MVFKRKTSFFRKIIIYKKWWPKIKWSTYFLYAINSTNDTRLAKKFVIKNKCTHHLLGYPIYSNQYVRKYDYFQKELIPLETYILCNQTSDNKKLLNKYMLLILETWKYGFSDKIFNFGNNCGIDENGNVMLFDFCEISFSKEQVKQLVYDKLWFKKESYNKLPKDLKIYFKDLTENYITIGNLELFWNYYANNPANNKIIDLKSY